MNWFFLICASFFLISPPSHTLDHATSQDAIALLVSPRSITPGASFRILISSPESLDEISLEVTGQQGIIKQKDICRGGGPPFWLTANFSADNKGPCQISVKRNLTLLSSQTIHVMGEKHPSEPSEFIWKSERSWTCILPGWSVSFLIRKKE